MDERSYFDENAARYDAWYEAHPDEYRDQVGFIGRLMPHGIGVEIGVGTGRFASKLGIKVGVDVSERMLSVAARRGILPILASAENLPFISGYFDFSIFIVTLCFLDNPVRSLREARRVSGLVISVILESGTEYTEKLQRERKGFYAFARFYTEAEVKEMYRSAGMEVLRSEYADFISSGMLYRMRYLEGR